MEGRICTNRKDDGTHNVLFMIVANRSSFVRLNNALQLNNVEYRTPCKIFVLVHVRNAMHSGIRVFRLRLPVPLQPRPHIFLARHPNHAGRLVPRALSVQPHDEPAHGPDVLPRRIEELPPAVWRRRRERYGEVARREEDGSAHYRRHWVQRVDRCLEPAENVQISGSGRESSLTHRSDIPMPSCRHPHGWSIPADEDS